MIKKNKKKNRLKIPKQSSQSQKKLNQKINKQLQRQYHLAQQEILQLFNLLHQNWEKVNKKKSVKIQSKVDHSVK
jgi:hypothetical protein